MTRLSVVVVNWNAGPVLLECLAALFATTPWDGSMDVLLVDNASTDGSESAALHAHPGLRVIRNRANVGFAQAVNAGLRAATGEFVLVSNPDVVLTPGAIPGLVAFMAGHSEAAVVGPRLLNPNGSVQGSARRDPSLWTGLFGRNTVLTRLFPANALTRRELPGLAHQGPEPLEVDWVSGACFAVRRQAWEEVGLMDERFFLFWEDADWCRRFRQAGWKVHYLPTHVALHHVGVSRRGRPLRSIIDFHQSAYRFYRKHFLPSPRHPMMVPLLGGLFLSLVVRSLPGLFKAVYRTPGRPTKRARRDGPGGRVRHHRARLDELPTEGLEPFPKPVPPGATEVERPLTR